MIRPAAIRPAAPEHVCPYCYEKFTEQKIMFRCTGRLGARGKTCDVRRDDELTRALNYVTPLPPVFAGDGRLPRAACPDCGEETSQRVCPHCHSRLPLHFGKVDSRMIALIGASQSGKTVFITVLINELNHRLGSILDASFMSCDDETVKSFRDYDYRLFEEHALPGRTEPVASRSLRQPLVFRLGLTRRARLGRPREEHIILSFFDTAGEDLTSQESVERNVRYLRNAHAVVLLLDPLQMPGARSQALQETVLPEHAGRGFDQPIDVLRRVTELLGVDVDLHRQKDDRVRKPVAVVLSKLDALEHTFSPGTPLTQLPDTRPEFDDRDSLAVHHQAQALLHEWDGPRIDQHMRHYFGCYRYFGVSALGDLPKDRATVGDVHPYRVHDPFLWLLSQFGAIPASRG